MTSTPRSRLTPARLRLRQFLQPELTNGRRLRIAPPRMSNAPPRRLANRLLRPPATLCLRLPPLPPPPRPPRRRPTRKSSAVRECKRTIRLLHPHRHARIRSLTSSSTPLHPF